MAHQIRRALAQSVSDHRPLERNHKKKHLQWLVFFVSDFIKKWTIFKKWTQKWTIPGKGLRNGLRNEQLLLFLAQIVVSCSEKRAREGGCQGAPGHGHRVLFANGGSPFFRTFFGALFPLKNAFVDEKCLQNGSQMRSFGTYFSEKVWKWKSVFGLRRRVRIAYEPIPWSAQGDQKNEGKTPTYFRTPLFSKINENVQKKVSTRCPNVVVYLGGFAPWGTFGAPSWFLIRKVSPQRPPKCPRDRKKVQKWTHGTPKWPQGLKNTPTMIPKVHLKGDS